MQRLVCARVWGGVWGQVRDADLRDKSEIVYTNKMSELESGE